MTAEIAILNKLAVALATDSAVTVSAGDQEQKTYDSADKLFDLSAANPIGIMIFHGLQFMQAPLQTLISEYRAQAPAFDTVKDAAQDFLRYLNDWAKNSPELVVRTAVESVLVPTFTQMRTRVGEKTTAFLEQDDFSNVDIRKRIDEIPHLVLDVFEASVARLPKASFIGGFPRLGIRRAQTLRSIVETLWPTSDGKLASRLFTFAQELLRVAVPSLNQSGIVIAGFGNKEKFPSLISFTIDGVIFDKLRYVVGEYVDIDRAGETARVLPFAQKEMVERFLYGLDTEIERQIALWCKEAVPEISNQIINALSMSDADREQLTADARKAEEAFISDLKIKRFEEIRTSSRSAIEGMVEFMPKPELARMAEALVNLTSIKRRVSRGMDTVGGPIDVAVISRTEGFIWVKRKHYFSSDMNPRYLSRISSQSSPRSTRKVTEPELGRSDDEKK